eukprot:EG_transcript_10114
MAAVPASLIIHIENFTSLPLNQRLIALQRLNFVELYYERDEDGIPATATDTIIIQKEDLRSAMLRGLLMWNVQRHAGKESMQHLCEVWQDFCREMRRAMYEYLPKSTESESYWRYKGPGELKTLLATLPPPTIPILLPRPQCAVPAAPAAGPFPAATGYTANPAAALPYAQQQVAYAMRAGAGGSWAPQLAPGQVPGQWATPATQPNATTAAAAAVAAATAAAAQAEAPLAEPKTNFCFPAYGGLQGAMIMVFGTDFDDDTKFLFDWPYAEPSGWSEEVTPEFVTPTGAVVRAPPLYCNTGGRKDVQVYILAMDAEGHTKGDAQYTYLTGRKESDHMWENLKHCLSEVDDGLGADDFDSSSKSWKEVDNDIKEADSEQALLQRHFERRHDKQRLLHGLQHCDVHGRSAVHYMAALAFKAVLRYCFDKLGKEGDRLLSFQDVWHLTPLHFAVAFERPATVELLLKHSTPQSRDMFRTPTPETKQTAWTLANRNEDVLYELDRGMEAATER